MRRSSSQSKEMADPKPFIDSVTMLRERVPSFEQYPFSMPAIRHLRRLALHPRVTFFVGENGTGKSTLLEAIAAVEGINAEGGSRNFSFSTNDNVSELKTFLCGWNDPCARFERPMRISCAPNLSTTSQRKWSGWDSGAAELRCTSNRTARSFLSLIIHRFFGNGLYLLDEPEAALSPLRQMSFLAAVHDLTQAGSQFIIATHSPIIMAYPLATIYWFSEQGIAPIEYAETDHYKTTKAFLR